MNLLYLFCLWLCLGFLFELAWLCLKVLANILFIPKSSAAKLYWCIILALLSVPIVDVGLPRCSTESLFSAVMVAVAHIWLTAAWEDRNLKPKAMQQPKHWRGL